MVNVDKDEEIRQLKKQLKQAQRKIDKEGHGDRQF